MKHTIACTECSTPFQSTQRRAKYCSRNCRSAAVCAVNGYVSLGKAKGIPSGTVGAIGELRVSVDLMQRGYEVFRALSPHCSCDLAVMKAGNLVRIEVRSGYRTLKGQIRVSNPKHRADVLAIALINEIIYDPPLDEQIHNVSGDQKEKTWRNSKIQSTP